MMLEWNIWLYNKILQGTFGPKETVHEHVVPKIYTIYRKE